MDARTTEQIEAHRRWLSGFELSPRDWRRVRVLAERAAAGETSARIEDLDSPWAVGVVPARDRRYYSGQLLGTIAGQAVLAWRKTARRDPS
ncbi:hypothetical protein [Phenylobacterium sp.]|uniref:hypothetical protein n=1 Tax=Phenylobacterium sp. TaxID=1871053 RepID=UPI002730B502|nr:hypothetical protein [Phenylobacterium sp.]MDP2214983.1 hypothetical protein [Phenylobacterium sp.]